MRLVLLSLLVALLGVLTSQHSVVAAREAEKSNVFPTTTLSGGPATPHTRASLLPDLKPVVAAVYTRVRGVRHLAGGLIAKIADSVFTGLRVGPRAALRWAGVGEEDAERLGVLFDWVVLPFKIYYVLYEQYPLVVWPLVLLRLAAEEAPKSATGRRWLRILGFGPLGPAKGTVAARLQSEHFGPAVPRDSWFAELQRQGMKA